MAENLKQANSQMSDKVGLKVYKRPRDDVDGKKESEQAVSVQHHQTMSIRKVPFEPRKIKKFIRCSKLLHLKLQTTTSMDENKLGIVISKGIIAADHDLHIQQHIEYQVNHTQNEPELILLATISKHPDYQHFNFQNVILFTQHMINNGFIRFRNHGPTQTKHVSLWRIYQFEGEVTLFNIWCILQAFEQTAAFQSAEHATNTLNEHILKNICSFLTQSKYHCWIHIHEIMDKSYHRSNLVGLEFDGTSRNVYVMRRSPALMKKLRQIGDRYLTKTISSESSSVPFDNDAPESALKDAFFQKSVEMFKAVY